MNCARAASDDSSLPVWPQSWDTLRTLRTVREGCCHFRAPAQSGASRSRPRSVLVTSVMSQPGAYFLNESKVCANINALPWFVCFSVGFRGPTDDSCESVVWAIWCCFFRESVTCAHKHGLLCQNSEPRFLKTAEAPKTWTVIKRLLGGFNVCCETAAVVDDGVAVPTEPGIGVDQQEEWERGQSR